LFEEISPRALVEMTAILELPIITTLAKFIWVVTQYDPQFLTLNFKLILTIFVPSF